MKRSLCILTCIFLVHMSVFCRTVKELDSIAVSSFNIGEYPKAAECYGEILRLLPSSEVFNDERIFYAREYSKSQLMAGGFRETEVLLKDSLYHNDATLRINLAAALGYQEKYDEATAIYNELLVRIDISPSLKGIIYQNMGYLNYKKKDYEAAESNLRQALSYFDGEKRYITMSNLALSAARNGKYREAIRLIDRALGGFKSIGARGRKDYIRALRKYAEIQYLSGSLSNAKRLFKKYFSLEREWLYDNLCHLSKTERLNLWLSEKQSLSKCFILEDYEPEFLYAVAAFRRLTSLLGINDVEKLKNSLGVSVDAIRNKMVRNSVSIEFLTYQDITGKEYYAAVVLPFSGSAKFIRLFPTEFLYEPEIVGTNSIFNAIKRDSKQDKDALYSDPELANVIWNPILENIPSDTKTIYFAPEGILHFWGIENMPFDGKNRFDIHRVSTTVDIGQKNEVSYDSADVLLIGGLNYSAIPQNTVHSERNHIAAEVLRRKVGATNVFKYLPATRIEVDSINKRFDNARKIYLAEEGEVKDILPNYRIIHIATHGYSLNLGVRKRPEYMTDSLAYDESLNSCALALTGANVLSGFDSDNDGLLSAREICELDLTNVEFAVLSACQTAQGDITDEGAAGLIRGLKNAGVKTVLATLWSVDDRSTMLFMNQFYKLLCQGKTKHDSYIGAQNYLIEYEKRVPVRKFSPRTLSAEKQTDYHIMKYDSPYYWAPFILIDDF